MERKLLDRITSWGVVDEVIIERCRLARVSGWSHRSTAEIAAPIFRVEDKTLSILHQYRYPRPDVTSDRPLAGIAFEYLLPLGTQSIHIDLGEGSQRIDLSVETQLYEADYSDLFGEKLVRTRNDIYGSGAPSPTINNDVRRLTALMRGRVIDFGCGSGALVAELRSQNKDAFGLEIDRPTIRQNLLADAARFVTFYSGGKAPFDDDHFDCATAFEVLEHIEAYQTALAEIARLAPMFILSVPDASVIPLCHQYNVVPWHLLESTHFNFFTETSLRKVLEQHYREVELGRLCAMTVNGTQFHVSLTAICRR